jgi:hypothetical protein
MRRHLLLYAWVGTVPAYFVLQLLLWPPARPLAKNCRSPARANGSSSRCRRCRLIAKSQPIVHIAGPYRPLALSYLLVIMVLRRRKTTFSSENDRGIA